MKKELTMALAAGGGTMLIALLLLRWLAPQLIGLPVDLQVVQVAEEVPSFFDGVFRKEDYVSQDFLIRDPYLLRARPLAAEKRYRGPNDILGFRNRAIPNDPTVITIGDSQTYGTNVPLESNWPSQLQKILSGNNIANANLGDEKTDNEHLNIYNMSVGGWGAAEYYSIFRKALFFSPRLIIVAFYSGNDPRDTFSMVYRTERWPQLRADPEFARRSLPKTTWPVPDSEIWTARLDDGSEVAFTPKIRHASNRDHPGIEAGYRTMAHAAKLMGRLAEENGVELAFLFIPTKELVFQRRLEGDSELVLPEDYRALIEDETRHRQELAQALSSLARTSYIEILPALQAKAADTVSVYPATEDGHPAPLGHGVIAETLAPEIRRLLE